MRHFGLKQGIFFRRGYFGLEQEFFYLKKGIRMVKIHTTRGFYGFNMADFEITLCNFKLNPKPQNVEMDGISGLYERFRLNSLQA